MKIENGLDSGLFGSYDYDFVILIVKCGVDIGWVMQYKSIVMANEFGYNEVVVKFFVGMLQQVLNIQVFVDQFVDFLIGIVIGFVLGVEVLYFIIQEVANFFQYGDGI